MSNYMKVSLENAPRVELHDKLGLTGAEISINTLPAGECVPFIHSHKQNEEIYYILSGSGKVVIDSEEVNLVSGDWLKISPSAERQFFASKDNSISYICIQTKENSGHTQQAFENDVKIMVFKLLSTEKRNPKCMD